MDLDNITDVEWLREQLKKYCIKVIKDIPDTVYKAGNYYLIDQCEAGVWLYDWDGKNYFDIYNLIHPEEYLEIV